MTTALKTPEIDLFLLGIYGLNYKSYILNIFLLFQKTVLIDLEIFTSPLQTYLCHKTKKFTHTFYSRIMVDNFYFE